MKRTNNLVILIASLMSAGLFAMPAFCDSTATGVFDSSINTVTFSFGESDTQWILPDTLITNPNNGNPTLTDAISGTVIVCDRFDTGSDRCSGSNVSDIVVFNDKNLFPVSPSTLDYYSDDEPGFSSIDISTLPFEHVYILEPASGPILWRPSFRDSGSFDLPGDSTDATSFGINNNGISYRYQFTSDGDTASTPEPSTWLLFGQGGLGVLGMAFRKLKKSR